jgi:hypothetical protein
MTKITKAGAGYIHNFDSDYRCSDCILFIPGTLRCAIHGLMDVIQPNGYCTYWVFGTPLSGLQPYGCVTKVESGYGELKMGTKCWRCRHFDGPHRCDLVDEKSPGADPGRIDGNACCSNQTPRVEL